MKNKDIQVLFSDIDGTLTDGRIYYSSEGESLKVFNVKDGMGITLWQKEGKIFGVLSARESGSVLSRINDLSIKHAGLGIKNKTEWMDYWLKENNFTWDNLAYIGDDINDIELMKKCKFSACPSDAAAEVKKIVHYEAKSAGGMGAVREIIELLLNKEEV
ncbi:MAG: HAD-IIIA family hydrolase [Spirochaetia bacterium]|nr:HAD-IIIA family hydrolase [Spirochaetia bacterium]